MLTKDLTVTITNEAEGITLTVKTVSRLGGTTVAVSGDPGTYDIKEIKEALAQIEKFDSNTDKAAIQEAVDKFHTYIERT